MLEASTESEGSRHMSRRVNYLLVAALTAAASCAPISPPSEPDGLERCSQITTQAAETTSESVQDEPMEVDPPHLVHVRLVDDAGFGTRRGRFHSAGNSKDDELNEVLNRMALGPVESLVTVDDHALDVLRQRGRDRKGALGPDMASYFRVEVPSSVNPTEVAAALDRLPLVAQAYLAPRPAPTPSTPCFATEQEELRAAPLGLGVTPTRSVPGARGQRVTVADVEFSWNTDHEDLSRARLPGASLEIGTPSDPFNDLQHGTASVSLIGADHNAFGINGIAPDAGLLMVNAFSSERGWVLPSAILTAAAAMSPGDVLLIEQQAFGTAGSPYPYVPVEWIPEVYDAIVTATRAGVIVIEPAGNGNANLDDQSAFGKKFPANKPDSGAIIVGAGAACGSLPDRSRLPFSGYGTRVDVQGPGECVTAAGYGKRYEGAGPNSFYTGAFSGTSSASALVAGVAAALSSAYEHRNGTPATPAFIRETLVATGTPQDLAAQQGRIGPMPNLEAALATLGLTSKLQAAETGPSTTALNTGSSDSEQLSEEGAGIRPLSCSVVSGGLEMNPGVTSEPADQVVSGTIEMSACTGVVSEQQVRVWGTLRQVSADSLLREEPLGQLNCEVAFVGGGRAACTARLEAAPGAVPQMVPERWLSYEMLELRRSFGDIRLSVPLADGASLQRLPAVPGQDFYLSDW
jgi:serine protease